MMGVQKDVCHSIMFMLEGKESLSNKRLSSSLIKLSFLWATQVSIMILSLQLNIMMDILWRWIQNHIEHNFGALAIDENIQKTEKRPVD